MPAQKISWRLFPPEGIAHQVRQLSLKENRSIANMAIRLIAESLDNRRIAHAAQNSDVKRLVSLITARSEAVPADAAL